MSNAASMRAVSSDDGDRLAAALAPWPIDDVPMPEQAERAVAAILSGSAGKLAGELVSLVSAEITDAERDAFERGGDGAESLRAAAGLRWRLAAALLTAPQHDARFDAAAVAGLLADADAVLAMLHAAPPASPAAAEAAPVIRKALVRDAVRLASVVEGLARSAQQAGAPVAKELATRILSIHGLEEAEAPHGRRQLAVWIVFALAVVAGVAYHGQAHFRVRSAPPRPPAFAGAPAGARGMSDASGRTKVVVNPGAVGAAELEAFRRAEEQRGNVVRELAPGVIVSTPPQRAESGGTP
jgi:hypothetical protein